MRIAYYMLMGVVFCFSALSHAYPAHTVVMVSPDSFSFNSESARTNAFASSKGPMTQGLREKVLSEFKAMVHQLRDHGIHVIVLPSPAHKEVPDAVFPNNWFSLHKDDNDQRVLTLYPMQPENRRLERQVDELHDVLEQNDLMVHKVDDITHLENQALYLESTGSMIFDRKNRVIFGAPSPRTSSELIQKLAKRWGYETVLFHAYDHQENLIYHTNVVMSLGEHFAVVCLECIHDQAEKVNVIQALQNLKKDIINISLFQVQNMCGNVLELQNQDHQKKLVMSQRAHDHFTPEQRSRLRYYSDLVIVDIETIEELGGGSARCMIAEVV